MYTYVRIRWKRQGASSTGNVGCIKYIHLNTIDVFYTYDKTKDNTQCG